jgi:hypothetical protein
MDFPIAQAVMNRAQQAINLPMGVADNVASRGMWSNPVYNLGMSLRHHRMGLGMGLGVSSGAAGAGQSGDVHIY